MARARVSKIYKQREGSSSADLLRWGIHELRIWNVDKWIRKILFPEKENGWALRARAVVYSNTRQGFLFLFLKEKSHGKSASLEKPRLSQYPL